MVAVETDCAIFHRYNPKTADETQLSLFLCELKKNGWSLRINSLKRVTAFCRGKILPRMDESV